MEAKGTIGYTEGREMTEWREDPGTILCLVARETTKSMAITWKELKKKTVLQM